MRWCTGNQVLGPLRFRCLVDSNWSSGFRRRKGDSRPRFDNLILWCLSLFFRLGRLRKRNEKTIFASLGDPFRFVAFARGPKLTPGVPPIHVDPSEQLDLSVVVPFYNPGTRLHPQIKETIEVLRGLGIRFEVIAVCDGSTDGSSESINGMDDDVLTVIHLGKNSGKGEALRVGLQMGKGRYLGFIDADGDIPPKVLIPFVTLMNLYEPDIILGSKRHPMSDVAYPLMRHFYSIAYQLLVRVLFNLNIRDTQTGIKLVRRDVLEVVLPMMLESGYCFDLELFVVAKSFGFVKFFEAPVTIKERFSSTISPRAVMGMLFDTFSVFFRLKVLHRYREGPKPTGN